MLIGLELAELLRALDFPGSDAFALISFGLLIALITTVRLHPAEWLTWTFLVIVPVVYGITSGRLETVIMAFSIATFLTFLQQGQGMTQITLPVRAALFATFLTLTFLTSLGDPIYSGSRYHSVFLSGNAYIYYFLITACIIAFSLRRVVVSGGLALPFVAIQTKSVVILAFSHVWMFLVSLLLMYPLFLFIASLDRIYYFLSERGLLFALASGRIQRLAEYVEEAITPTTLLIGSPFAATLQNFEIEFVDIVVEFGLIYGLILYLVSVFALKRVCERNFGKVLALFLLLNVSGHFWNNPLVVIIFVAFALYVGSPHNDNVPGQVPA